MNLERIGAFVLFASCLVVAAPDPTKSDGFDQLVLELQRGPFMQSRSLYERDLLNTTTRVKDSIYDISGTPVVEMSVLSEILHTATDSSYISAVSQEHMTKAYGVPLEKGFDRENSFYSDLVTQDHIRGALKLTFVPKFSSLARSMSVNDPVINYNMGYLSENGVAATEGADAALRWYERAADLGVADAAARLSAKYWEGTAGKVDTKKFLYWNKRAADLGDSTSQVLRGKILLKNQGAIFFGVSKNVSDAMQLLEKAADQNYSPAIFELGVIYQSGEHLEANPVLAKKYFQMAAEEGHPLSKYELGRSYLNATPGFDYDPHKAQKLVKSAAKSGVTDAQMLLGDMMYYGIGGVGGPVSSIKWYEAAAASGDAQAFMRLGDLHSNGFEVPRDLAKAIESYEEAARVNITDAFVKLGVIYANPSNADIADYKKAISLFEKAAEKGSSAAKARLGVIYRDGKGVSVDYVKASRLLEDAAASGDAYGQVELGKTLLIRGQNVKPGDASRAIKLFQAGSAQGNTDAFVMLGRTFESGTGVAQNLDAALTNYQVAAEAGDPSGVKEYARLHWELCQHKNGEGCNPVPVFYATNRPKVTSDGIMKGFSDGRSSDDDKTHFGVSTVLVPRHSGDIETRSIWKPLSWFSSFPSDEIGFVSEISDNADNFFDNLNESLKKTGNSSVIVFVHGYWNSFETSVRRAAQMSHAFKFTGIPVAFSWPSANSIFGYGHDETAVKSTCPNFREFVGRIAALPNVEKVLIFSHSMGTRLVFTAFTSCEGNPGRAPSSKKFREAILVSGDIDKQQFIKGAAAFRTAVGRITLYVSDRDLPLWIEEKILRGSNPRIGQGKTNIDDAESIDVRGIPGFNEPHFFAYKNEKLKSDVYEILKNHAVPDDRYWPIREDQIGPMYWAFR